MPDFDETILPTDPDFRTSGLKAVRFSREWKGASSEGAAGTSRPTPSESLFCSVSTIREDLGELDHAPEILLRESTTEVGFQLSPQRGDDLGAILRSLFPEDLTADAVPNSPIKQRQAGIDHTGGLLPASMMRLRTSASTASDSYGGCRGGIGFGQRALRTHTGRPHFS